MQSQTRICMVCRGFANRAARRPAHLVQDLNTSTLSDARPDPRETSSCRAMLRTQKKYHPRHFPALSDLAVLCRVVSSGSSLTNTDRFRPWLLSTMQQGLICNCKSPSHGEDDTLTPQLKNGWVGLLVILCWLQSIRTPSQLPPWPQHVQRAPNGSRNLWLRTAPYKTNPAGIGTLEPRGLSVTTFRLL